MSQAPAITYYDNTGNAFQINPTDPNYLQIDPFLNYTSPYKGLPFPANSTVKLCDRMVDYSATTLGTTTKVYRSLFMSDIKALADYYADWDCSYKITMGPMFSITVEVPWDEVTGEDFIISPYATERWEIVPTVRHKPLLSNGLLYNEASLPTAAGNYVILPDILKGAVQTALRTGATTLVVPPAQASALTNYIPMAQKMLSLIRSKCDSVIQTSHTIKRTAFVDTRNTNQAFQTAADQIIGTMTSQGSYNPIYSAKKMQFQYGIPDDVFNLMLPSYKKKLHATGIDNFSFNVYAGYMVTPPTKQFITRNKCQITQLFDWDEWVGGMYYVIGASDTSQFPVITNNDNPLPQ